MKHYVESIVELVKAKEIRCEVHSFDSGAFMIDLWIKDEIYCVQLFNQSFGISRIREETGLSSVPDVTFEHWESFQTHLKNVIDEKGLS